MKRLKKRYINYVKGRLKAFICSRNFGDKILPLFLSEPQPDTIIIKKKKKKHCNRD